MCEVWLCDLYFPQFRKSDMSKYGYLKVCQRVLQLRDNESQLYLFYWSESELFTGDTSKDNHSPGPVFSEVSP